MDDGAGVRLRQGLFTTWRELSPLIPSGSRTVGLIALTSLVGAVTESIVLVAVVNVALGVASTNGSVALSMPLLGQVATTAPPILLVAAAAAVATTILHGFGARLEALATARTIEYSRARAISAFSKADWARQSADREGRLQQTTTVKTQQIGSLTTQLSQLVSALLALAGLFGAAIVVDPVITAVVLVAGGGLFAALRPIAKATKTRAIAYVERNNSYAEDVSAWTRMSLEQRVFGVEDVTRDSLLAINSRATRSYLRARFLNRLGSALYKDALELFLVVAVTVLYLVGTDDIAAIGSVVLLIVRSLTYATQTQSALQELSEQMPNLESYKEHVESLEAAAESWGSTDVSTVCPMVLDHVSYAYDSERHGVADLSLRLDAGDVIGIIGASGAGKTTLLQLLLRLRLPTSGTLTASGINYADIDPAVWRRRVALVPQDPLLFEGTIEENIRFYRAIADTDVRDAVDQAGLTKEVSNFPAGLATRLGPRGSGLSGGQRQRVAIARALAGKPDVLLLDEPTSALDPISERVVQASIEALRGTVTMLIVAHRLSTLAVCDEVVVMTEGQIAFTGSLEEATRFAAFETA